MGFFLRIFLFGSYVQCLDDNDRGNFWDDGDVCCD